MKTKSPLKTFSKFIVMALFVAATTFAAMKIPDHSIRNQSENYLFGKTQSHEIETAQSVLKKTEYLHPRHTISTISSMPNVYHPHSA